MDKPILVHVPKTAGGAVRHSCPWLESVGHLTFREAIEKHGKNRLYFSIVRHPVDRFVSCMALIHKHLNSPKMGFYYVEFLNDLSQGTLGEFVSGVAERLNDNLHLNVEPIQMVMFRSMYEQLQDIPVVIFYEWLPYSILMIADKVGAPFMPSDLQRLGITKAKKPELSNDTITLIENCYKTDMQRYGYDTRIKAV